MKPTSALCTGLFLILTACSHYGDTRIDNCGFDPNIRRSLSVHGARNYAENECTYCLVRITSENGNSVIYAYYKSNVNHRYDLFLSKDGGQTWTLWPYANGIIPDFTTSDNGVLVASQVDSSVVYRNRSFFRGPPYFQLSMDGQKTLSDVYPKIGAASSDLPGAFVIIGTGVKERNRVYARGTFGIKTSVYLSDDYGYHFRLLVGFACYANESASQPSCLYGFNVSLGLMRSDDGGVHWSYPSGGNVLLDPLFSRKGDMLVHTWRSDTSDLDSSSTNWLQQIEIDPFDSDRIYVVTYKGLYRSDNGGKTFRLLPLGAYDYRAIERIRIDPINSNILYASVDRGSLYKSKDWGCNWIKLPEPQ